MYVQEHDPYTEAYRGAPGVVFWAIWLVWVVVTYIGFTLGETLGQMVERIFAPQMLNLPRAVSLEGYVAAGGPSYLLVALGSGLVAGLVLGIGQGLVLLPFLKLRGTIEWVGATIIGMGIGWVTLYALSRAMSGPVLDRPTGGVLVVIIPLAGVGIIVGLALGYPQGIVLQRRGHHATWWALANIAGPIVVAVLVGSSLYAQVENTIRDSGTSLIALATGAITGIALLELLRHPTMQAEWMERLRWRGEQPAKQADTVLGSAYYQPAGQGTQTPVEPARPNGGEGRGD